MKVEEDQEFGFGLDTFSKLRPPSLVSLSPFAPSASPAPRRLSSCFSQPSQPIRAKRQLAWVSLQGRLVGAEEASSARAIGGGLSPDEAVAWELFTPIQRVLVIAVIAVAASNSKKNKRISELEKSVQLRDQVLLSMQQKLDNLCEQVNYFKDQPESAVNDCWLCEQHKNLPKNFSVSDSDRKMSMGEEMFKSEMIPGNEAEQEERRMSDMSDLAPSVVSSVDIQANTVTIYQDIYNLRRDCEEKDATINKLSTCLQSSEALGSKRVTELEDIIRRKNMIISKLRKDILVLDQKVTNLTRLRRPSFSKTSSNLMQVPVLTDNIIYDMDSTTSPSSSDSDSYSPRNKTQTHVAKNLEPQTQVAKNLEPQTPVVKNLEVKKNAGSDREQKLGLEAKPALLKVTDIHYSSRPASPLKEISLNQTGNSVSSSKSKQMPSARESTSRRRPPTRSKLAGQQKRWV